MLADFIIHWPISVSKTKKPTFGSSANISLTGSKFNVGDIEPELIEIADVVIDHGTSKYVNP